QSKLSVTMPANDGKAMIANTVSLLKSSDILKIPVLLTEQYPKGLGPTDSVIVDNLPATAQIFAKTGFSCCLAEGFNQALEKHARRQIILVGQESHVCILQTAVELLQLGYQVHVLEDAVCSRKPEHKFYALKRMQQQGVIISNYESVLFECLRDANHPNFKTISNFLR
ncbi:MAG: isochorismatase family protein, partial [Methylococcales bacterium]